MTQDRRQRCLALSFAPLSLLPVAALAQAQQQSQAPLDEVIVTATLIDRSLDRVPAAVSVVTQDDIQHARQQLAIDEALAQVPGLFMQNRYNFAQDLRVSIRGFGARAQFGIRGIKVLVDGIPETLPDGQGAVDSIDLGATKQIEVIRGPSSSMYGNAAGGVISLMTEGAGNDPYVEARVSGGSFGYEKTQLKTAGKTDRLDYLVSVSNLEIDGYRAQSRAVNRQATGRFNVDLGKDRTFLTVLNLTDQPQSDDPGGVTRALALADPRAAFPNNVTFHAGEEIEQQRLGFVYTAPAGEHGTIKARNYYAWRDFGNLLPVQNAGIVDLDRGFVGGGFSYTLDGVWLDRPNRLIAGVDFDDQDDDRRRFDNLFGVPGTLRFDQNEHVTSQGLFVQDELSLSKKMQLTMGVRFDEVEFEVTDHYFVDGLDDSGSRKFNDTSPMVGLTVQASDDVSLYATYSSSFETPTTTEFNQPDGSGGFNQNLDPQVAKNLEVGVRARIAERQRLEVSVFNTKVDDELIPFEIPTSPGRVYYQNIGESRHRGVEVSWLARLTDRLRSTVSYAYADMTFNGGLVIPGTSKNTVYASLSYEHPRGWFVAGDALSVGDQFGDNQNSAAGIIDGYTVANLRAGYEADLGKMTLSPFVGINNLTDESYTANVRLNPVGVGTAAGRYFEQGPDRNLYAGVTLNWKLR